MRRLANAVFLLSMMGAQAEAIGQIATEFGQAHGIGVQTQFGHVE